MLSIYFRTGGLQLESNLCSKLLLDFSTGRFRIVIARNNRKYRLLSPTRDVIVVNPVLGGDPSPPDKQNIEVVHPQLWIFDFDLSSWICVDAESGGRCPGPAPPAVFDHTATLVGKEHIVVVGGVMVGRALNSQASRLLE